jgi:hypothetical protein
MHSSFVRGTDELQRDAIFGLAHYGGQGGTRGSSVRAGGHKLIELFEDGQLEMYNLRDDVSEENHLGEERPQVTERLHARLVDWREEMEAKRPQENAQDEPRD